MDPAIKQGFAIGLVVAIAAGYFGWREGWWPAPGVKEALEGETAKTPGETAKAGPEAKTSEGKTPEGKTAPQPPAGGDAQAAKPSDPKPSDPTKPQGDVAALTAPGDTPAPAQAPADKGAFDVVRVEPTGEAVVAGRCEGRCVVELTVNGRTLDKATADDSGAWAMTPPTLPPGDHQLGLKVTKPDGQVATSEQSVTVSVPQTSKGDVAVVLNEPNAPSKILQRPGQEPQSAATAPSADRKDAALAPQTKETEGAPRKSADVSIGAVDAEKGRLFVQGTAAAGATLRVYLNNALVAQPVAGREERWSVRIERGLTPGDYVARVDQVEKPSGKVVARAEAKFAYEGEVAGAGQKPGAGTSSAAAAPQPSGPASPGPATAPSTSAGAEAVAGAPAQGAPAAATSPQPDDANQVVASIDTTNVRRGDSLWRISRKTYGSGVRYTVIFTANDKQIRDPNLIYPGQVLVLPEDPEKASARR